MLACEEGKVGGLNLLQLVDCLHWGHHCPEGKNIPFNTAPRRTVVLMFILPGGRHGPEGKNIYLNTVLHREGQQFWCLYCLGGHHGPEGKNTEFVLILHRGGQQFWCLYCLGGHHGPEGKSICLHTAPRRIVVLMFILPGEHHGPEGKNTEFVLILHRGGQ